MDVNLYTKKGCPEKNPARVEADLLKFAEESEHQQMEMMIKKRMRQISLTESESISDIAKLMINEMENESSSPEEQGCYSDDEFCLSGRHAPKFSTLKHVNSEPNLHKKSESFDALCMEMKSAKSTKCKSASPPSCSGASAEPDLSDVGEHRGQKAAFKGGNKRAYSTECC